MCLLIKHLFPAPDMKRGTHAHEENRACKALTHAAWAAQIQGDKCCHLFPLRMQEAGVLMAVAHIRLTSELMAAAGSPEIQSSPWVLRGPSEARGQLAVRATASTICKGQQSDVVAKRRWAIGQQDPHRSPPPGSRAWPHPLNQRWMWFAEPD